MRAEYFFLWTLFCKLICIDADVEHIACVLERLLFSEILYKDIECNIQVGLVLVESINHGPVVDCLLMRCIVEVVHYLESVHCERGDDYKNKQ